MQPASLSSVAPIRILIAAAEDTFRQILRGQLGREPRIQVVGEARDSRLASRLLTSLSPDLLVIEGELNRELQIQHSYNGNVIVIVTSADPRRIVEALALGARSVLLKASLPLDWAAGIARVVAGQYWMADESISLLLGAARQLLAQPETPPAREFGLTPRETEIARRIAAGGSNRELGQEFSICERTVKHHLTNIFRKTGVSSRLELALLVRDAGGSNAV